jgi:hypothetical protein
MAGQQTELDTTAETAATARIAEANRKMTRYRAALDAGGDPEEIGKWIADAKAQRLQAEADLRRATTKPSLTRQQIQTFIKECADIATQLRDADPNDMAQAYRKLGLRLTYHPGRNLVHAAACPPPATVGKWFVSEGGHQHRPVAYLRNACIHVKRLPGMVCLSCLPLERAPEILPAAAATYPLVRKPGPSTSPSFPYRTGTFAYPHAVSATSA